MSYGMAIMRCLRNTENNDRREKSRNQTMRLILDFKPSNETTENVCMGNEADKQGKGLREDKEKQGLRV
jgi:hypothetical protein